MDAARQLTQLLDRHGELRVRAVQELLGGIRIGAEPGVRKVQGDGHRDEALLSAVVEVALDPPPLFVGRGAESGAGRSQLSPCLLVRQRKGDELREGAESLLGTWRE